MAARLFERARFAEEVARMLPNARIEFKAERSELTIPALRLEPAPCSTNAGTSPCSSARTSESLYENYEWRAELLGSKLSHDGSEVARGSYEEAHCPETYHPQSLQPDVQAQIGANSMCTFGPSVEPLTQHPDAAQRLLAPSTDAAHRMPPLCMPTCDIPHMQQWDIPHIPQRDVSCADEQTRVLYRVAIAGGIHVRAQPSVQSACTGVVLPCNHIFAVSGELVGSDGRVYLRLNDGQGWAFDDSALSPQSASVVRGHWSARCPSHPPGVHGPAYGSPSHAPGAPQGLAHGVQAPAIASTTPFQHQAPIQNFPQHITWQSGRDASSRSSAR